MMVAYRLLSTILALVLAPVGGTTVFQEVVNDCRTKRSVTDTGPTTTTVISDNRTGFVIDLSRYPTKCGGVSAFHPHHRQIRHAIIIYVIIQQKLSRERYSDISVLHMSEIIKMVYRKFDNTLR